MPNSHNRKLLGGWFPERSPSTMALVWQSSEAGQTRFTAEVTRVEERIDTLEASSLDLLAEQLIAKCGRAPRSMVRLGVDPAVYPAKALWATR